MFQDAKFYKPGGEIAEKARAKVGTVADKLREREGRIAAMCAEHALSPCDLFALAQSGAEHASTGGYRGGYGDSAYNAPVLDLPAGVVSSLVTESEQIESERHQVRTLELLARNIDPGEAARDQLRGAGVSGVLTATGLSKPMRESKMAFKIITAPRFLFLLRHQHRRPGHLPGRGILGRTGPGLSRLSPSRTSAVTTFP